MIARCFMYSKFFKRLIDIILSFIAISVLLPIIILLAIFVAIFMKGNPFFTQIRPTKVGKDGKEKLFRMIKFRTMTNERDEKGELLPDDKRLNKFGKILRSTSLDELPELFNILKGDMSIVGPRPQLVRDMVFMSEEQRRRHSVRAGLTGLAQVSGRNNISWEQKLSYDIEYIENISFGGDVKIIFRTVKKVFKREDTVREGTVSDMDFGDWLLQNGDVDKATYDAKQAEAKELLKNL
jgi:lipopolysaccharide/colanic/teichoic acid biosynthesis glycosyltransferase